MPYAKRRWLKNFSFTFIHILLQSNFLISVSRVNLSNFGEIVSYSWFNLEWTYKSKIEKLFEVIVTIAIIVIHKIAPCSNTLFEMYLKYRSPVVQLRHSILNLATQIHFWLYNVNALISKWFFIPVLRMRFYWVYAYVCNIRNFTPDPAPSVYVMPNPWKIE